MSLQAASTNPTKPRDYWTAFLKLCCCCCAKSSKARASTLNERVSAAADRAVAASSQDWDDELGKPFRSATFRYDQTPPASTELTLLKMINSPAPKGYAPPPRNSQNYIFYSLERIRFVE